MHYQVQVEMAVVNTNIKWDFRPKTNQETCLGKFTGDQEKAISQNHNRCNSHPRQM